MGLIVANGVGSTEPFLTMTMVPSFLLTKSRLDPSGAQAMPVKLEPTFANELSLKFESRSAALPTPPMPHPSITIHDGKKVFMTLAPFFPLKEPKPAHANSGNSPPGRVGMNPAPNLP